MDLRYELYLRSGYDFYSPDDIAKDSTRYIVDNIPSNWIDELDSSNHWRYLSPDSYAMPPQGWKIHITCTLNQSQETLKRVSKFLIENNIAFKFVCSEWELAFKNSKYGDRSSSGKFITIYPPTEYVFIYLLEALEQLLRDLDKGVYILNDNRWKDSNVFFRYGAFVEMQTLDGQPAILNEKNELIPDMRLPYYSVPDFVNIPIEINKMEIEKQQAMETESLLDNYDITEVLHFSNGGGVYKAFSKKEERFVIIKEGRNQAGIDGGNVDSFKRIDNEYSQLLALKDVPEVIQVFEKFQVWEHNYLVEEFFDGISLNSWLTDHFPFIAEDNDFEKYSQNVLIILDKIVRGIEAIHRKEIGIGDLSLTNILINSKTLDIKFIDFEVASNLTVTDTISLRTPGYSTDLSKNREEADWFSCLRIAYNLLMPISSVNDISLYNEIKMNNWIKSKYSEKVFNFLTKLKERVYSYFPEVYKEIKKYEAESIDTFFDVKNILQKLRNGLLNSLDYNQPRLSPGDIRQFEMTGGMFNVFTGGFGVILALHRTGGIPEALNLWIETYSASEFIDSLDGGLFTGKSGIACVLSELGYNDLAENIISSIDIDNMHNISLFTGLSGVGLAYLSFYISYKKEEYLTRSKAIGEKIITIMESGTKLDSIDPDFLPMGLLEGWSGAVILLVSLYKKTRDKKWLKYAEKAMDLELKNCELDSSELLNIKDDFRLLPYLCGGSIGVGIALLTISKESKKSIYLEKFKQIEKAIHTTCSFSAGLFRGFGSFLLFYSILKSEYGIIKTEVEESLFKTLTVFLIEEGDKLSVPGEFGFRISYDLFSGSAGLLLVLAGIINNDWKNWIPIMKHVLDSQDIL